MYRSIAIIIATVFATQSSPAPQSLIQAGSIDLPRVDGRIDHLAFDAATQRLFVAALGNNTVEVLDVKGNTHLKSLTGFHEPQGIAIAADARQVGVAHGQGDGLQLLSAEDYRLTAGIKLGDDPDHVRYDAAEKRLYVGFGSGAVAAVDPAVANVLGEAKLAGTRESVQLGLAWARLCVNVPSADQSAVVDRTAMTVSTTWRVATAKTNYPMALDEASHRLFVGCRR